MICQLCEIRAEIDRLNEAREAEWLALGTSLLHDIEGPLPIRVTLNKRPTKEQWRRMLDLCIEIENNPYSREFPMSNPIMVSVDRDTLEALLGAAEVCAEDLTVELKERYKYRETVPTEQRRYNNDMMEVETLMSCVSKIRSTL